MNYIICHYGEIGLKGKNRAFFEGVLIKNIKKSLRKRGFDFNKIKKISGRIIVETNENSPDLFECLRDVLGIVYLLGVQKSQAEIKAIKEKAVQILKQKKFQTFKVETKRSNKNFPLTSPEINQKVGEEIMKKIKGVKVDLNNPDITLFIEIVEDSGFLGTKKIPGRGGLPVGVSGKGVCLLSGGIDSPVAAFKMMQRGMKIIFVHFTSYPFTDKATISKVKKIIETLNRFQFSSTLYIAPITDFQKEVKIKCKESLRVILYRRFMLKLSEKIAKKEKAHALITGDSLGQVASQTIENLKVTSQATDLLILRPLIAVDKINIINKAKEINTYQFSIMPGNDICQRFMPLHPETKANLKEIKDEEKKINIEQFLNNALKKTQKETIK